MLQVLLPGDRLPSTSTADHQASLIVGPGLQLLSNSLAAKGKGREAVVSNRAGLLGHVPSTTSASEGGVEKWWIEGSKKRVRRRVDFLTSQRHLEPGFYAIRTSIDEIVSKVCTATTGTSAWNHHSETCGGLQSRYRILPGC